MPLLDLRTNPFQEEGNDERKVEIEHVIDEILKIMQASVEGEFGFYRHIEDFTYSAREEADMDNNVELVVFF